MALGEETHPGTAQPADLRFVAQLNMLHSMAATLASGNDASIDLSPKVPISANARADRRPGQTCTARIGLDIGFGARHSHNGL